MNSHWREAAWGDLATLEYGKSLQGYQSSTGPYKVFGTNGQIGWHSEPLCPNAGVIIGRKGAYRGVHYSPDPFFVIDTAFYLKPKEETNVKWAYYQLLVQDINGLDSGSAIPSTSREDFYSLPVSLPPLPEQRAIAHILGTLDDKIELNRRMNQTLEEMARAIYKDWFVDFGPVRAKLEGREAYLPPELWDLFPDRLMDSELGEIPEGWEVKELGELLEFAYGKALKADNRRPGEVPVYGSNGPVNWHDEKLVDGPSEIIGRKGNPGFVHWCQSDFFPIDTTFYAMPRGSVRDLPYFYFAIIEQDFLSLSADSAVPGLSRNLAYMNKQALPSPRLLKAFIDNAERLFERCAELEKESLSLSKQRNALLPRLVSGEVRIGG